MEEKNIDPNLNNGLTFENKSSIVATVIIIIEGIKIYNF